ncbi:MAG: TIGR03086 family metal-binding protein [Acidimicrobiales bacterium]
MPQIDLQPAANTLAGLLEDLPEDALDRPTPCPDFRLTDLLGHVGGFALAFRAAATKDLGELTSRPPAAGRVELEPGWRTRITADLAAMADAWKAPDAWDGMTRAGGIDLPGEVAGRVALDELVVHGWDVARASGQPYECDDASLREVDATVRQFRAGNEGEVPGLFGPVVPVSASAPLLDQVLGLTGRDPGWSAPRER